MTCWAILTRMKGKVQPRVRAIVLLAFSLVPRWPLMHRYPSFLNVIDTLQKLSLQIVLRTACAAQVLARELVEAAQENVR
jgi:hypothetical protein